MPVIIDNERSSSATATATTTTATNVLVLLLLLQLPISLPLSRHCICPYCSAHSISHPTALLVHIYFHGQEIYIMFDQQKNALMTKKFESTEWKSLNQ